VSVKADLVAHPVYDRTHAQDVWYLTCFSSFKKTYWERYSSVRNADETVINF